jgi:hypothetical protein
MSTKHDGFGPPSAAQEWSDKAEARRGLKAVGRETAPHNTAVRLKSAPGLLEYTCAAMSTWMPLESKHNRLIVPIQIDGRSCINSQHVMR